MSPALLTALVAACLAALLGALAWTGRRLAWPPELRRKAAHIALGLGCATFPWLFSSPAPVWTLATLAVAGLALLRLRAARASTLGSALHAVDRRSCGELVFPLAIALVFHASAGRWDLYVPPVLVLALADAAGALVGRRFGRHPLRMEGAQRKSLEGGLAVFAVAAPCVAVPLALFAGWTLPLALAVALLVAGLAALVEGVAIEGLDNLFLPLLAFAVLARAETWSASGVLARLACLIAIVLLLALVGRRLTPLTDAALMGLALALYLFASLGGVAWLAGPLALAALYLALNRGTDVPPVSPAPARGTGVPPVDDGASRPVASVAPASEARRHPLAAVVAVAAAPLAWLALAPAHAFAPALAAFAAQAVLMILAERRRFLPGDHRSRWPAQAALGAACSLLGFFLA